MVAKSRSRIAPSRAPAAMSAVQLGAGIADAMPVELPDPQIDLASMDDFVLHVEAFGVLGDRLPGEVGVVDIRDLVHMPESELLLIETEALLPALALRPGIAVLARSAAAIARDIRALGASIGDNALEPVTARHQPFPRRPGHLGRRQRLGADDFLARHADGDAELGEDFPMRFAAAEFIVGDDLLAAGLDDFELRVPIRDVGGDLQLQHRVALARVEPVLLDEGARPSRGDVLALEAVALAISVHHLVHALQNLFRAHRALPC